MTVFVDKLVVFDSDTNVCHTVPATIVVCTVVQSLIDEVEMN